jgi:hypothetical protein
MIHARSSFELGLLIFLTGTQLPAMQGGSTPSTPNPSTATAQAAAAPASGTYSIEAEIFAYKSLASNSTQIANDVGDMIGAPPISTTGSASQTPAPAAKTPPPGVVIVPSVTTILPAFQAWRSNMLVIQNFLNQANVLPIPTGTGCPTPAQSGTLNVTPPSFAAYATGVSQAVGVIQSIVSLFANNDSVTEYPGTIQDQALMAAVARVLRARQTQVLIPDLFAPWTIDLATSSDSPFISKLGELITVLMRLQNLYQCNQLVLNAAAQLQQAETLRAADFAKLTDAGLTAPNRTAVISEIRAMKAQIDYFRLKLGLDLNSAGILNPEADTMETEFPRLTDTTTSDAVKAAAVAAIRRNDAAIIGSFENPLSTTATLTSAKAQALITGIQGYLAGLTGGAVTLPTPTAPTPGAATAAPAATGAAAPTGGAPVTPPPATTPSPTVVSPAPSTPPILAVLQADGLARRMNVVAGNQNTWNFSSWRILWLKSMESGGAIIMHSNIFGAHPHFSGGAISGYALFQISGTLVCSGNAGSYGGYVDPKHFTVRAPVTMIDLGPGCAAAGAAASPNGQ